MTKPEIRIRNSSRSPSLLPLFLSPFALTPPLDKVRLLMLGFLGFLAFALPLLWLATLLTGFQMSMVEAMAAVIYSGALERYLNLKIVIGEAGIGWIPYVLERMDYEWEDQFKDLELRLKPSEYWYRQMYASYQQDQTGIDIIEKVGVNNVMWGSDFPHPDGIWPDSQEYLQQQLGHLPEWQRRKIVYENAAKLYGFPMGQ